MCIIRHIMHEFTIKVSSKQAIVQFITLLKYKPMPDITMCSGKDCPFRDQCYRYTAKSDEYQAYFSEPPIKDGKCDYYWGENAQSIWNQLNDTE